MELVIHGTKGGWNILFPKTSSMMIPVSDVRAAAARPEAEGQTAYSIAYVDGECAFSKLKIIRDMRAGMRIGFIAVTLFVEAGKMLDGESIKTLLDYIMSIVCPNNKIVDTILPNEIQSALFVCEQKLESTDYEYYRQPTGEAAYIYYASNNELLRYFDERDQDEYSQYKQIYLISRDLKGYLHNPINALHHNPAFNLTGLIDLNNPKYRLLFNENERNGQTIAVKAAGKSQLPNNKIRGNSRLEITYCQPFRKQAVVPGTCREIFARYPQCISMDEINKTITIKAVSLRKECRVLSFSISSKAGKSIDEPAIVCKKSNLSQSLKFISSNQIMFEGDEIGESWDIEVHASGHKPEKYIQYKPMEHPENNSIECHLDEQKIIEIQAVDKNNTIIDSDYKIAVFRNRRNNKPKYQFKGNNNKFVFVGNEIHKEWEVEIDSTDYEFKYFTLKPLSESETEPLLIKLKEKRLVINDKYHRTGNLKDQDITITFKAGRHGKIADSANNSTIVRFANHESIVKNNAPKVLPSFLYKFAGWKPIYPYRGENRITYEARFKPFFSRWIGIGLSVIVLGIIVVPVGFRIFYNSDFLPKNTPITIQGIDTLTPDAIDDSILTKIPQEENPAQEMQQPEETDEQKNSAIKPDSLQPPMQPYRESIEQHDKTKRNTQHPSK